MRVLLDANILISLLVSTTNQSPVHQVIQALFEGQFRLLLPDDLLAEFVRTLLKKPRLRRGVRVTEVETLVTSLTYLGEPMIPIGTQIPSVSRDPKDDYLLAYARLGRADYLVTGDQDLLVLKRVGQVKIVSPRTFIARLKAA